MMVDASRVRGITQEEPMSDSGKTQGLGTMAVHAGQEPDPTTHECARCWCDREQRDACNERDEKRDLVEHPAKGRPLRYS